jgi:hypothetical protein
MLLLGATLRALCAGFGLIPDDFAQQTRTRLKNARLCLAGFGAALEVLTLIMKKNLL